MSDEHAGRALALFSKAPTSPDAKTRLARDVGRDRARAINSWLVRRSLALRGARRSDIDWFVYVASATDRAWFDAFARGWEVRTQSRGDIGTRLAGAFQEVFDEGYEALAAIGSDIPGLRPELVRRAIGLIEPGRVVLGPTLDGGYYLIGLASPGVPVFSGIEWSGSGVCEQTARIALDCGLDVLELPPLRDIDAREDWEAYLKDHEGSENAAIPSEPTMTIARRASNRNP